MNICSTSGKGCYPTEEAAIGNDDNVAGIYFCPVCECWHRTRGEKSPPAQRLAQATREAKRERESFITSPLAARLDPEVVEALLRIKEAS